VTGLQKERINDMRESGYSYTDIATALGISKNTVKSYCQRNKLAKNPKPTSLVTPEGIYCKQCGEKLKQIPGRKIVKFCSHVCRVKWWNSHLELVNKKAVYSFICDYCNKPFTAYGNAKRKYCSHSCYIANRFGKTGELQ
jgi:hypothetical protein